MHDEEGSDGACSLVVVGEVENSNSICDENGKMGHHEPSLAQIDEEVDGDKVSGAILLTDEGDNIEEQLETTNLRDASAEISSDSAEMETPQIASHLISEQEETCSTSILSPTQSINPAGCVVVSEEVSSDDLDLERSQMSLPASEQEENETAPASPSLSVTPIVADSEDNPVQQVAVEESGMIGSIEILQELYQRKCKECEGLRKTISFLNEAVKEAEDLVYEKSCEIEQMELRLQGVTYLHEEKRDDECRDKVSSSKSKKKKNKKKDNPVRRPIGVRPKAPPTPEGERKRNDSRIKRKAKSKEGENPITSIESELMKMIGSEQRKRSKSFENRKHDKENDIRNKRVTKTKSDSTHSSKKSQNDDSCTEKSERTKRKEALLAAISARDGNAPPTGVDENHEMACIPAPDEQLTSDGDDGVDSLDEGRIKIPVDESKEAAVVEFSVEIVDGICANEEASFDVPAPARDSDGIEYKEEMILEISVVESDEIPLEADAIEMPNEDAESSSLARTNSITLQSASSIGVSNDIPCEAEAIEMPNEDAESSSRASTNSIILQSASSIGVSNDIPCEAEAIEIPNEDAESSSRASTNSITLQSASSVGVSNEIPLEADAIEMPNEDAESSSLASTNSMTLQNASLAANTFEVETGSNARLVSQQAYSCDQSLDFAFDDHIVFSATENLPETKEGRKNGTDVAAPENQHSDCSLDTIPFSTDHDPYLDQYSIANEPIGSSPHSVTSVEQLVITSALGEVKNAAQVIQGCALFSGETDLVVPPSPPNTIRETIDLDRSDDKFLLFVDETQNLGIDLEFVEENEVLVDIQTTVRSAEDTALGVEPEPAGLSSKPQEAPTSSAMQDSVYIPSPQVNEPVVVRVEI